MKILTPEIKSFELKSTRSRLFRNRERMIYDGFNVFVESNLSELIDKFFTDNKIYSLSFKCKTWNKLKNIVTKAEAKVIAEYFKLNEDASVKYSVYAGCSCGCSPGFRVRKVKNCDSAKINNSNVWVKLKFDLKHLKSVLPSFEEMLKKEIKSH